MEAEPAVDEEFVGEGPPPPPDDAYEFPRADAPAPAADGGDDGGYREFKIDDLDSAKRQARTEALTKLRI